MLKKIIFSSALILSVALIAFAADKITGSWVGSLDGDDRVSYGDVFLQAEQ